jgi:iron(III) transport system ATP-binding protein
MADLIIDGITASYPGTAGAVLKNLSLTVQQGDIAVLLGQSGCGKTTLLRILAGFIDPDAGMIHFKNRTLVRDSVSMIPEKRKFGFVFQDFALFPHLTVRQNVEYGLGKLSKEKRRAVVENMLMLVGLDGYGKRYPFELSGGQQQRVALARSLAPQPDLLLLDEPFNNLDVNIKSQMLEFVKELLRTCGTTAIVVSHDFNEAAALADKVAIMDRGQIVQYGTIKDIVGNPCSPFVQSLVTHHTEISSYQ